MVEAGPSAGTRTTSRRRRRQRSARRPFLLALGMALVRVASRPIAWAGADVRAVHTILETKLQIDLRHGGLFKREDGHKRTGLVITVLMLILSGAFVSLGVLAPSSLFGAGSLFTIGLVCVLTLVLLADYSGLIVNPADDQVIGPCPVDDRTLLVSQLLHLAVFMTICVAAVCVLPLAAGVVKHGLIWAPGLLLCAGLAGSLAILGVVVLYLGVSRIVGPQRSQGAMLGVQIGLMVVLMGSSQLIRFVDLADLSELMSGDSLWLLAVPPLWFGGLCEVIAGSTRPIHMGLAGCGILGPLAALVLALRLSSHRSRFTGLVVSGAARARRPGLVRRLGGLVCRSPLERGAYDLFVSLSTRERGYRLRTWPMLAYPLVMFLVPMFGGGHDATIWQSFLVYAGLMFVVPLIVQSRYSDCHEAGWLFAAAPVSRSGELLSGTIKGLCVCYLLPWALVCALFGGVAGGPGVLLDVALGAEVLILVSVVAADGLLSSLPFTRRFLQSEMSSQVFSMFLVVFCGVGLGWIHYLLRQNVLTFGLAVVAVGAAAAWKLRTLAVRGRVEAG